MAEFESIATVQGKPRRAWRALRWVMPIAVLLACAGTGVFLLLDRFDTFHDTFHVGVCFQESNDTGITRKDGMRELSGRVKVVDCSTEHDAEITRAVSQASDCFDEGAWLKSQQQVYCVRLKD